MSEKYDGIRMVWTGTQFTTAEGRVIEAPHQILSKIPIGISLEGELW